MLGDGKGGQRSTDLGLEAATEVQQRGRKVRLTALIRTGHGQELLWVATGCRRRDGRGGAVSTGWTELENGQRAAGRLGFCDDGGAMVNLREDGLKL
ncbi:hypothetical protein M0R45_015990 [Rubus argutus]|uniref:Uncharacterized protein n=1 Tax=Rubus argutus TaxID=59490 RepID=A0AAW1XSE2_RUBAR